MWVYFKPDPRYFKSQSKEPLMYYMLYVHSACRPYLVQVELYYVDYSYDVHTGSTYAHTGMYTYGAITDSFLGASQGARSGNPSLSQRRIVGCTLEELS